MDQKHDLTITVAADLPEPTRVALEATVTKFGARILDESNAIEEARQITPGPPMITPSTIEWAERLVNSGHVKPSMTKVQVLLASIERFSTLAAGGCLGLLPQAATDSTGMLVLAMVGSFVFAMTAVICFLWVNWGSRRDA